MEETVDNNNNANNNKDNNNKNVIYEIGDIQVKWQIYLFSSSYEGVSLPPMDLYAGRLPSANLFGACQENDLQGTRKTLVHLAMIFDASTKTE